MITSAFARCRKFVTLVSKRPSGAPLVAMVACRSWRCMRAVMVPRNIYLFISKSVVLHYDKSGNATSRDNYKLIMQLVFHIAHLSKRKLHNAHYVQYHASVLQQQSETIVITFCVSRRRRKMYCGHARLCVCLCVCLSVCLSVCPRPYAYTTPRTRM